MVLLHLAVGREYVFFRLARCLQKDGPGGSDLDADLIPGQAIPGADHRTDGRAAAGSARSGGRQWHDGRRIGIKLRHAPGQIDVSEAVLLAMRLDLALIHPSGNTKTSRDLAGFSRFATWWAELDSNQRRR